MKTVLMSLMLLVGTGVAHAQGYHGGSFRQSCNVPYDSAYSIQAYCLDTRGNSVYNDFNPASCQGDIANIDGYLQCARGGGGGGGGGNNGGYLPNGSYSQTCNSCSMNGSMLQCSCEDTQGYYHWTYINMRYCGNRPVANLNGRLTCQ